MTPPPPSTNLQAAAATVRASAAGQAADLAEVLEEVASMVDWWATLNPEELAGGVKAAGFLLAAPEDFADDDQFNAFEVAIAVASRVNRLRMRN